MNKGDKCWVVFNLSTHENGGQVFLDGPYELRSKAVDKAIQRASSASGEKFAVACITEVRETEPVRVGVKSMAPAFERAFHISPNGDDALIKQGVDSVLSGLSTHIAVIGCDSSFNEALRKVRAIDTSVPVFRGG